MKRKKENQKALPTGWREVQLGEVCTLEYGKPLKEQDRKDGRHPVFGSNGIVGYHDEYLITGPFIIVGRKGSAGMVQYSIGDGFPIDTTFYVKAEERQICLLFLYYLLLELNLKKWGLQSGVPGLNRNDVHKMKIPFPPLPEQKAIASLLETWDTAIEKTEALIAAKEKRFKWLLKTLINDQQNNPGWQKVKLGEIANLYQPKTIPKKDMRRNGQYKVFGANGVIGYYHKYNHEEAEIAVVCRGATCGRVNMTEPKSWITGNAMVVKPDKGCVKKSYLYYFLSGASLTACISGAAQPQITRQDLFHFQTIISTNSEQKQIATTLETAEREIELQKRLTEQCRRQKHGLMQKLLTGEWRLIPSFPRKWK